MNLQTKAGNWTAEDEYALLKSLIDSMKGYPESVKFLHKNTG